MSLFWLLGDNDVIVSSVRGRCCNDKFGDFSLIRKEYSFASCSTRDCLRPGGERVLEGGNSGRVSSSWNSVPAIVNLRLSFLIFTLLLLSGVPPMLNKLSLTPPESLVVDLLLTFSRSDALLCLLSLPDVLSSCFSFTRRFQDRNRDHLLRLTFGEFLTSWSFSLVFSDSSTSLTSGVMEVLEGESEESFVLVGKVWGVLEMDLVVSVVRSSGRMFLRWLTSVRNNSSSSLSLLSLFNCLLSKIASSRSTKSELSRVECTNPITEIGLCWLRWALLELGGLKKLNFPESGFSLDSKLVLFFLFDPRRRYWKLFPRFNERDWISGSESFLNNFANSTGLGNIRASLVVFLIFLSVLVFSSLIVEGRSSMLVYGVVDLLNRNWGGGVCKGVFPASEQSSSTMSSNAGLTMMSASWITSSVLIWNCVGGSISMTGTHFGLTFLIDLIKSSSMASSGSLRISLRVAWSDIGTVISGLDNVMGLRRLDINSWNKSSSFWWLELVSSVWQVTFSKEWSSLSVNINGGSKRSPSLSFPICKLLSLMDTSSDGFISIMVFSFEFVDCIIIRGLKDSSSSLSTWLSPSWKYDLVGVFSQEWIVSRTGSWILKGADFVLMWIGETGSECCSSICLKWECGSSILK